MEKQTVEELTKLLLENLQEQIKLLNEKVDTLEQIIKARNKVNE